MAASSTEICNLALSWLGGQRIISLDDPSTEGQLCKANYDSSRRAVLDEREWTFCVKRVQLSPLVETPLFGYSHAFLLPTERLALINVYDPASGNNPNPPSIQHAVEGDRLYANLSRVDVKYKQDVIDPTLFNPLFDQTLAAHIAMLIAVPLTENAEQQARMAGLYEEFLHKAASSNGMQGSREILETSQLENVRRVGVRPR